MALPRSQQEIQEQRTKLGIEVAQIINRHVDLSKGKIDEVAGKDFYKLFLNREMFNPPKNIQEVRESLQKAWWVEEEDIRQFIYMSIWRLKLTSRSYFDASLGWLLRDHLINKEKVFTRHGFIEITYSQYLEEQLEVDLDIYERSTPFEELVLATGRWGRPLVGLTIFERYLLYLRYVLCFTTTDTAKILLTSQMQVRRFLEALRPKLEDIYVRRTDQPGTTSASYERERV